MHFTFKNYLQISFVMAFAHNAYSVSEYSIKLYKGVETAQCRHFFVEQRLQHYLHAPYLYCGTAGVEQEFFDQCMQSKDAGLLALYADTQLIGVINGYAFSDFIKNGSCPDVQNVVGDLEQHGVKQEAAYYMGDIMILPQYRNDDLGAQLFSALHEHAKSLGYISTIFFIESGLHPEQEGDFNYTLFGYTRLPVGVNQHWDTLQSDGSVHDQNHVLHFWIRNL